MTARCRHDGSLQRNIAMPSNARHNVAPMTGPSFCLCYLTSDS